MNLKTIISLVVLSSILQSIDINLSRKLRGVIQKEQRLIRRMLSKGDSKENTPIDQQKQEIINTEKQEVQIAQQKSSQNSEDESIQEDNEYVQSDELDTKEQEKQKQMMEQAKLEAQKSENIKKREEKDKIETLAQLPRDSKNKGAYEKQEEEGVFTRFWKWIKSLFGINQQNKKNQFYFFI